MSRRSQVSRIALWRCSLNVFVFVFVIVFVFVFVIVFVFVFDYVFVFVFDEMMMEEMVGSSVYGGRPPQVEPEEGAGQ